MTGTARPIAAVGASSFRRPSRRWRAKCWKTRAHGADVIAAICPLCDSNLDARQVQIKGLDFQMPILYATQLMALAFGLDEKSMLLKKCIVDPLPLLHDKGFVA